MNIKQISSAIYNDIVGGLRGITSNPTISVQQLEDEVVSERNLIMREFLLKGIINLKEFFLAINCLKVDCANMSKCCDNNLGIKTIHFEIPPILYLNGINTIKFIGSIDRKEFYTVYTDSSYRFHKWRKRGSDSPYVYIDLSINKNGNIDGYIFNKPFVKEISIEALFMDPRKVANMDCCSGSKDEYLECGILSDEIQKRLTEKKIRYYRQLQPSVYPNDQIPK